MQKKVIVLDNLIISNAGGIVGNVVIVGALIPETGSKPTEGQSHLWRPKNRDEVRARAGQAAENFRRLFQR